MYIEFNFDSVSIYPLDFLGVLWWNLSLVKKSNTEVNSKLKTTNDNCQGILEKFTGQGIISVLIRGVKEKDYYFVEIPKKVQ